MNIAKQALWLSLLLNILSGCGWYFAHLNPVIKLDNDALLNSIDSTITHLKVRQYDDQGLLANRLTTPLMEHVPKKNIHLLKEPRIVIHQKNQPAWYINSTRAKSFDGGQHITFIKNVVVHQASGINTEESTLKTEKMTYYPNEKKATTPLFVTYEHSGNTAEAIGMNAYLDEKRVELLHRAKGSYAPVTKG